MKLLDKIWEKFLMACCTVYMVFQYLFSPDAAWGAVWAMFVASFITKMLEISYCAERQRMTWRAFRDNFSSTTALFKLSTKSALFLLLMFILARGEVINPAAIGYLRSGILSIAFTIEAFNSVQHMSVFPSLERYTKLFSGAIKKHLWPKGFEEESKEDKE